jgi:hypothetical protein
MNPGNIVEITKGNPIVARDAAPVNRGGGYEVGKPPQFIPEKRYEPVAATDVSRDMVFTGLPPSLASDVLLGKVALSPPEAGREGLAAAE